jgi:endonuclease/exonuclease/phosphatase family metal-dependent hydrolase
LSLTLPACTAPASVPTTGDVVAVTFNTGTGGGYDPANSGAFGTDEAEALDRSYGNGLAWVALMDQTAAWFDEVNPDLVAFQEVFWPGDCATIPPGDWPGFVCEGWSEGDPTVVEAVLGPDYQVACNLDHPDKCLAVHRRFGTFRGCDAALCLDGLDGAEVDSCGSGARIGRGTIDRPGTPDGTALTVVGVHGSSGFSPDDHACRVAQFAQVFDDLDGEPGANGTSNLILGDFNTDPGRWADVDASAAYVADRVGPGTPFRFVTEVGPDAPPTYLLANIDHVIADQLDGDCWHAGAEGHDPVSETGIFDHLPAVCTMRVPAADR